MKKTLLILIAVSSLNIGLHASQRQIDVLEARLSTAKTERDKKQLQDAISALKAKIGATQAAPAPQVAPAGPSAEQKRLAEQRAAAEREAVRREAERRAAAEREKERAPERGESVDAKIDRLVEDLVELLPEVRKSAEQAGREYIVNELMAALKSE